MPLMDAGNYLIWQSLKLYLPNGTSLTSVRRNPEDQLKIIVNKARKEGYTFDKEPTLGDRASWIGALAFLRTKKYKIAEPGKSNHDRGLAYDLSGPNLNEIKDAVQKAVDAGRITLLKGSRSSLLIESANNCVHVEIESAILDFEPFEYA